MAGSSWKGGNARKTYYDKTGLSDRVDRLNVEQNTPATVSSDMQFQKAMQLCGNDFTDYVLHVAQVSVAVLLMSR